MFQTDLLENSWQRVKKKKKKDEAKEQKQKHKQELPKTWKGCALGSVLGRQGETTQEQTAAEMHESDQGGSEERSQTEERLMWNYD